MGAEALHSWNRCTNKGYAIEQTQHSLAFNEQPLAGNFPLQGRLLQQVPPMHMCIFQFRPSLHFQFLLTSLATAHYFLLWNTSFPTSSSIQAEDMSPAPRLLLISALPHGISYILRASSLFHFSQPPKEALLSPLKQFEYSVPFHSLRRPFWEVFSSNS